MKIHYPQAQIVLQILTQTIQREGPTDQLLFKTFRSSKQIGKKDRTLISDLCFGILRVFEHISEKVNSKTPNLDHINYFLQMAGGTPLVFRDYQGKEWEADACTFSCSKGQDEKGREEFGKVWTALKEVFSSRSEVFLKFRNADERNKMVSFIKTAGGDPQIIEALPSLWLSAEDGKKIRMIVDKDIPFPFEIQDLSCQKAVEFYPELKGKKVWEVCCGNGGKTLDLAAQIGPNGDLLCSDISPKKLEEMSRRMLNWGNELPRIMSLHKQIFQNTISEKFDAIFIDTPCSGSGTWRRSPWLKLWERDGMAETLKVQANLLSHYAQFAAKGGKLVYSTCSIWKEENQMQIQNFLSKNPEWTLETEQQFIPQIAQGDGFYLAVLGKTSMS